METTSYILYIKVHHKLHLEHFLCPELQDKLMQLTSFRHLSLLQSKRLVHEALHSVCSFQACAAHSKAGRMFLHDLKHTPRAQD
eukprot:1159013-Pelagomonas_calceolata.AAC.3